MLGLLSVSVRMWQKFGGWKVRGKIGGGKEDRRGGRARRTKQGTRRKEPGRQSKERGRQSQEQAEGASRRSKQKEQAEGARSKEQAEGASRRSKQKEHREGSNQAHLYTWYPVFCPKGQTLGESHSPVDITTPSARASMPDRHKLDG
jgi:hypothetical protein